MKSKNLYPMVIAAMIAAGSVSNMGCSDGNSADQQRIADSIRRSDSISQADSIKAVNDSIAKAQEYEKLHSVETIVAFMQQVYKELPARGSKSAVINKYGTKTFIAHPQEFYVTDAFFSSDGSEWLASQFLKNTKVQNVKESSATVIADVAYKTGFNPEMFGEGYKGARGACRYKIELELQDGEWKIAKSTWLANV